MRVSIDNKDSGYETFVNIRKSGLVHVLLDGAEVMDVITADEESDYVLAFKNDKHGNPIQSGGQWEVEERRGSVKILIQPDRQSMHAL